MTFCKGQFWVVHFFLRCPELSRSWYTSSSRRLSKLGNLLGFFLTLSNRPVFSVSSLYSSPSFSNLFPTSFFPCLRVISRSCANATLEERRDPAIDKASFDAFLYRTLSWLDSLKRCHPRGSFVDNDVNRRTRTKKYIEPMEPPKKRLQPS